MKDLFKTSKGKYVAPVPIENKLGASPLIEAVCVGGSNQPETFALVLLSEEARKSLADEGRREEMSGELEALMNQVNEGLDPHEHMAFTVIVNEPWTIDNGFLTPTMKLRRNIVEAHYEPRVTGWFKQKQPVIWES